MRLDRYIYPKMPGYSYGFCRIDGNGLANCLFVYARAIVDAYKNHTKIIYPAWVNISIWTYLQKQKDKRHYIGYFKGKGEIKGVKKFYLIIYNYLYYKLKRTYRIKTEVGLCDFFRPLLSHQEEIRDYLLSQVNPGILKKINGFDFKNTAAIHVRLGDFPMERRVPLNWFIEKIKSTTFDRYILFSDGNDEELKEILELPNVERVSFGGALQDIIAISKCQYLIGSNSSFSAWGAFLGQVPCVFYKLQFGRVLKNKDLQEIENP